MLLVMFKRVIRNGRCHNGDDVWVRFICRDDMDVDKVKNLVILFDLFCVDFKFGTIISCQLDTSKIISFYTEKLIVLLYGWLN